MMIPRCIYRNAQLAAQDMREATNGLVARPYSYFDPENTIWWLIPSTEWPAYRFPKIFFVAERDAPVLFAGIYVEKGLSRVVAESYHSRPAFAMNETWAWHGFNDDMRNGSVSAAATEIALQSNARILLQIEAGVSIARESTSFDPHDETTFENPWEKVQFEVVDGRLRLLRKELVRQILPPVLEVPKLAMVPDAIAKIPKPEWTWIDLLIGVNMEMPSASDAESVAEAGGLAWDANAVWRNCLRPWGRWVS